MMRRLLFALIVALIGGQAHAQNTPAHQVGVAVPSHLAKFLSNGSIADVGGLLGDTTLGGGALGVKPFAVTDLNGKGVCLNTGASSGQFNAFCLGHDSSGNALLTVDSYGGLADKTFSIKVGGQTITFPGAATSVGAAGVLQKSAGSGLFAAYAGSACGSGLFATGVDASGNAVCGTPPDTPPAGSTGNLQKNAGSGAFGAYAGTACPGAEVPNGLDASGLVTGCAVGVGFDLAAPHTYTALNTFNSGLAGAITNPTNGGVNDRLFGSLSVTYDHNINLNSGFTDANLLELTETSYYGQGSYGGGTNAKTTFLPINLTGNYAAQGQRFLIGETLNCLGMGDCFAESRTVTFAGADIGGDEGQGFEAASRVRQQNNLTLTTVSGVPTRTTCNTTLAQGVTGSITPQDVSVVSTAGCVDNDWVVVDTELPTATPNHEPVQITRTGVAAGKIRGIFRNNHTNGHVVTPALVMTVASSSGFGQGRLLVDLSGTSYTTGTVASISGGAFTGSGTTWTTGIVGDNGTNNIGCISLTNDNYSGSPFNGSGANGTLKSWYAILQVSSGTSLGIYKTSAAGDGGYNGKGVGSGGYTIRPCAEVLLINGNQIILSTSAATWTNGDNLELSISPYPDIAASQRYVEVYTPGGALREVQLYRNNGARTFDSAITIDANLQTGGGADTVGWASGLVLHNTGIGITMDSTTSAAAMVLPQTTHGSISWGPLSGGVVTSPSIGYATVGSAPALLLIGPGGSGTGLPDDFGSLALSKVAASRPWMGYNGQFALAASAGSISTRLRFHDDAGDPNAATSLVDARYVSCAQNADSQARYWTAAGGCGVIFSSKNPAHTGGMDIFVLSGNDSDGISQQPGQAVVGSPEQGTATNNTTNKPSGNYRFETSVWNGSAAVPHWMQIYADPASGVNNAQISLKIQATSLRGGTYYSGQPDVIFALREDGVLSFGTSNPFIGSTSTLATFDPTGLTADRTFTLPNVGGTFVLTTAPQALTFKTLTDQIDQEAHINTATISKTDTTLASITGLAQSLTAAGLYSCHGHLHFTTAPTGSNGAKIALATSDTLTVNTLEFTVKAYNAAAFVTSGVGTATALGSTAISTLNAITDLDMDAAINVLAAGTLQVQLAENTASGTIAATAGNAAWECHRAA